MDKTSSCIALFSGGLDSILAVRWIQELGYTVIPVFFSAPYITPEKAVKTASENNLKLIIKDITPEHLKMMENPVHGFGKNFNPCIDCHAMMFHQAGLLLEELEASFLISGEVLGQRPMSQRRNALQAVNKLSGIGDLIIRPLSQKLLPDTKPIREGWVDKNQMLAIHGRGRTQQMELAQKFGLSYPPPGGGCLLTDRNFTLRLRELVKHGQDSAANIRLLRWGRHFRLDERIKLIVGRTEADNQGLETENFPGMYFMIRDAEGPLGLLTDPDPSAKLIALAASIVLAYSSKAPSPGFVKYGVDKNFSREICVEKCAEPLLRPYLISLDKEL
ncbi:MAG: tRNA (5-methylaminomethyl-2-thiouridylate)-methyltransferase [Candidatus Syntrophosphaera sp.]|nr:tRNA (5-methylaminomethyl-2-thiouridylate)-methyltransferase [Candidatus Syntrophosphaera sp.]